MCGRFSLITPKEAVEDVFTVAGLEPFPPRYNIAPTQPILIVVGGEPRAPGDNRPRRCALLVRWGLWPSWVSDPREFPLIFNARAETVAEKPSFRAAMRHRRILVPASGFYEWRRAHKSARGQAQAYWLQACRQPVAFAGVMETWTSADGSQIDTAAILTTPANQRLSDIHDRMPLVIAPADFDAWLDCRNCEPRDMASLIRPAADDTFNAIPVSNLVNNAGNTAPEIQNRVEVAQNARTETEPGEPQQQQLL